MITMDVKGITWVGNIYEKFENMCLEVEEMMYEDTVKYIENQVQTVGASVKKFCSDVVQDLVPPSSCDSDEKVNSGMLTEYTDAGVHKKSYISVQERPVKDDAQKPTKDPRISGDFYRDVLYVSSHNGYCKTDAFFTSASRNSVKRNSHDSYSRQNHGSTLIKSNLGINENQKHKKVSPTKTLAETTLRGGDKVGSSPSCKLLHENHEVISHHVDSVSEPASAEVTRLDSVVDSRNEIENANAEQVPNVPIFVKSVEEKQMNTSPISFAVQSRESDVSSGPVDRMTQNNDCSDDTSVLSHPGIFVQSGESDVRSGPVDRMTQHDDCSDDTSILSHPEMSDAWCWDPTETGAVVEQCYQMTQEDNKLDLEETCVMVNGNEVQSVPKAGVNERIHKKKMRQAFSLRKKHGRKQEYEQLAVWYGMNVKDEGDCLENSIPTSASADQKQSLIPKDGNVSEAEWELV